MNSRNVLKRRGKRFFLVETYFLQLGNSNSSFVIRKLSSVSRDLKTVAARATDDFRRVLVNLLYEVVVAQVCKFLPTVSNDSQRRLGVNELEQGDRNFRSTPECHFVREITNYRLMKEYPRNYRFSIFFLFFLNFNVSRGNSQTAGLLEKSMTVGFCWFSRLKIRRREFYSNRGKRSNSDFMVPNVRTCNVYISNNVNS